MGNPKRVNKIYIQERLSEHSLSKYQKELLERYLFMPMLYVPHDNFQNTKQMESIIGRDINVIPGKPFTADHECVLFQQMNYTRFRMFQIRRVIFLRYRWPKSKLEELLNFYQYQQEVRNRIVTGNMGLVLTMVQRCEFKMVEFVDLVSDGSMALLCATENFDVGRGFKFSTYACHVIYRSLCRTIQQYYRHHKKFPIQWDTAMEKDDYLEQIRKKNYREKVGEICMIVNKNLADLSQAEQPVVKMLFPFNDPQQSSLTLEQTGKRLGLSKERIRQIKNKAISKLRITVEDRMVIDTTRL